MWAKQSQFPADEVPYCSTMPSFQGSNPIPVVQTKPIWRRACPAKQSQLAAWPIAPNKANWPCTGRERRWRAGPEAPPPRGTSVRNKANSKRETRLSYKQSQFREGPVVQNKINLGRVSSSKFHVSSGRSQASSCAKQSQFAGGPLGRSRGPLVQNKPNWRVHPGKCGTCYAKENPISVSRVAQARGPVVQTKPIGRRARYPTIPVCHHSRVPIRGNPHQLLDAGWSGSWRPPRHLARKRSAAA
jgi:hypothetical protein